jgi:hypothetical protein
MISLSTSISRSRSATVFFNRPFSLSILREADERAVPEVARSTASAGHATISMGSWPG